MKALFLFPPNWSACVSGPHLGLPLISGSLKNKNINSEVWDLSQEFYKLQINRSLKVDIRKASDIEDIASLDKIYFSWENNLTKLAKKFNQNFGLLSGFTGGQFKAFEINDLIKKFEDGTVFSFYFEKNLKDRLISYCPDIVGITISSFHQIFPTIELILKIKKWYSKCKIVLGGNVVTRLQGTTSFYHLKNLVDKIIVYQGEKSIVKYCYEVLNGIRSKEILSTEKIDYNEWPIPNFNGLNIGEYPGENTISYVSTRGCYYGKCSFCAIPAGWSKSGYSGSADGHFTVNQIKGIINETGINKIKFVDEAFPPTKIRQLYDGSINQNVQFYWEAYARVEKKWEEQSLLKMAYDSGCRRLYFGLEISPDANRTPLNKNDKGDINRIIENCKKIGILIHLFCMVGHPGTTIRDAELTVNYLINNQDLIDTADLVGFRLDRGTNVNGVKKIDKNESDFAMNYKYEPTRKGILNYNEVSELEYVCQEILWENVPRMLHPLYRIGKSWPNTNNVYNCSSKRKSYQIKVA